MSLPFLPIISIIIPAYNSSQYIERCIHSCFNQDFSYPYEIVVCDDGSTDATYKLLSSLFNRYENINILQHKENFGLSAARNTCIKNSDGRYVFIMDSDDYIHPKTLSLMHACFELMPQTDYVRCDYVYIDSKDQRSHPISSLKRPIACGSLIKKSLFINVGLYEESLSISEEREFFQRVLDSGAFSFHLPLPLYRYMQHDQSITAQYESKRSYDCSND